MKSPARAALAAALCLFGPPIAAQLIPGSTPLPLGPMGGSGSAVAVDPADAQNVLLIKYTQGLFRSADGGITWAPYGSGISANARELVPDPANGQVLYSLDGNQVMKSTDFGAIWSPLGLVAIENLKGVSIASSGGGLLASDAFNVYHSPDGGTSWSVAAAVVPYAGEVIGPVAYAPSDPSIAYYSSNDGVYRSNDGGVSFGDPGPFDKWTQALTVSPVSANVVFAGTPFHGVFRSTDGGQTFSVVGLDLTPGDNGEFFAWDPDGRLWYALLDGLAYSPDLGTTWQDGGAGMSSGTFPIPLDMAFDSTGGRWLGAESGSLSGSGGAVSTTRTRRTRAGCSWPSWRSTCGRRPSPRREARA